MLFTAPGNKEKDLVISKAISGKRLWFTRGRRRTGWEWRKKNCKSPAGNPVTNSFWAGPM